MKRTGLNFCVEGEYVTEFDWRPLADPKDQDWIPFDNSDIHPWGKPFFTAWSQFSQLTEKDVQEMADQIVEVIDWLLYSFYNCHKAFKYCFPAVSNYS